MHFFQNNLKQKIILRLVCFCNFLLSPKPKDLLQASKSLPLSIGGRRSRKKQRLHCFRYLPKTKLKQLHRSRYLPFKKLKRLYRSCYRILVEIVLTSVTNQDPNSGQQKCILASIEHHNKVK
jgi:hypothetical protein